MARRASSGSRASRAWRIRAWSCPVACPDRARIPASRGEGSPCCRRSCSAVSSTRLRDMTATSPWNRRSRGATLRPATAASRAWSRIRRSWSISVSVPCRAARAAVSPSRARRATSRSASSFFRVGSSTSRRASADWVRCRSRRVSSRRRCPSSVRSLPWTLTFRASPCSSRERSSRPAVASLTSKPWAVRASRAAPAPKGWSDRPNRARRAERTGDGVDSGMGGPPRGAPDPGRLGIRVAPLRRKEKRGRRKMGISPGGGGKPPPAPPPGPGGAGPPGRLRPGPGPAGAPSRPPRRR